MPSLSHAEITPNHPFDYHWSPANQREFLEELAISGVAKQAAHAVSMSKHSAYRLRHRRDGLAFRIGWEAAIMIARGRLIDDLMERALEGYTEIATRSEDGREITRFKYDTRSAMAMVHRFDKRIDGPCEALPASELVFARIASQDFEAYLDLVETGGAAAQLSLFLAARSDLAATLSGSHLSQISADDDDEERELAHDRAADEEPLIDPVEAANSMSVWHCDERGEWRTDFPPPEDFDGDEDGIFGEGSYNRSLTEVEERIQYALQAAALRPLRDAAKLAYDRWFSAEGSEVARAEMEKEAQEKEARRARRAAEQAAREVETKTSDAIMLPATTKLQVMPEPPPLPDPTFRAIHCEPPVNYPANGRIPPWAERIC